MVPKPTCNEPGCTLQFRTVEYLRNHLNKDHGLDHPESVITFQTKEEYDLWKVSYEADNFVNFRHVKKKNSDKNGTPYQTFCCNRCYRSGVSPRTEVQSGQKAMKATGSVMMNVFCTCRFTVFFKENEIMVKLFPTHYNHDLSNKHKQHLKLSKPVKDTILNKLKEGVPRSRVIQGYRDEYFVLPEEDARPEHFASADTIYNIWRTIGDQSTRKAPDDLTSAKKWVEEHPDDFIYAKFQYEIDRNVPVRILIFVSIYDMLNLILKFLYKLNYHIFDLID